MKFFGTWMSRDVVYVALTDAPREIVKRWRAWCAEHGKSHRYASATPLDEWYF